MDKTVLLNEAKQFSDQLMSKVNIVKQIFYPPQNNRPNYIVNDGRPLVGDQFPTKRPGRNSNNRERNPTVHPFLIIFTRKLHT